MVFKVKFIGEGICHVLRCPCFVLILWSNKLVAFFHLFLKQFSLWSQYNIVMKRQFKQWGSSIPLIYQQSKQLPLIWTELTEHWPLHMTLAMEVLAWYRHKNVAGLNRLMVTMTTCNLVNYIVYQLYMK